MKLMHPPPFQDNLRIVKNGKRTFLNFDATRLSPLGDPFGMLVHARLLYEHASRNLRKGQPYERTYGVAAI